MTAFNGLHTLLGRNGKDTNISKIPKIYSHITTSEMKIKKIVCKLFLEAYSFSDYTRLILNERSAAVCVYSASATHIKTQNASC